MGQIPGSGSKFNVFSGSKFNLFGSTTLFFFTENGTRKTVLDLEDLPEVVEVVTLGLEGRLDIHLAELAHWLQEDGLRWRRHCGRPRNRFRASRRWCTLLERTLGPGQLDPVRLQHGVQRELAVLPGQVTVQVASIGEFLF